MSKTYIIDASVSTAYSALKKDVGNSKVGGGTCVTINKSHIFKLMKLILSYIIFSLFLCACSKIPLPKQEQITETNEKVNNAKPNIILPDGYEEITYAPKSNCFIYQKDRKTTSASGDFNGDGVKDEAKLIVQKGEKKEFLYIWLSKKKFQPLVLDEIKAESEAFNNMSLSLAKPGNIVQTACSRGYSVRFI